jgi:hypothetical protein
MNKFWLFIGLLSVAYPTHETYASREVCIEMLIDIFGKQKRPFLDSNQKYRVKEMEPRYLGEEKKRLPALPYRAYYMPKSNRAKTRLNIRSDGTVEWWGNKISDSKNKFQDRIFKYVMDSDGNFYLYPERDVIFDRNALYHYHSSFFAGKPVAAAGQLKVTSGLSDQFPTFYINRGSGHYQPTVQQLIGAAYALNRQGVPLERIVASSSFDGFEKALPLMKRLHPELDPEFILKRIQTNLPLQEAEMKLAVMIQADPELGVAAIDAYRVRLRKPKEFLFTHALEMHQKGVVNFYEGDYMEVLFRHFSEQDLQTRAKILSAFAESGEPRWIKNWTQAVVENVLLNHPHANQNELLIELADQFLNSKSPVIRNEFLGGIFSLHPDRMMGLNSRLQALEVVWQEGALPVQKAISEHVKRSVPKDMATILKAKSSRINHLNIKKRMKDLETQMLKF